MLFHQKLLYAQIKTLSETRPDRLGKFLAFELERKIVKFSIYKMRYTLYTIAQPGRILTKLDVTTAPHKEGRLQ